MNIEDVLKSHGVGSGGASLNKKFMPGAYSIQTTVEPVWSKTVTFNTDHLIGAAFNKATNELWFLDARNRKIVIHDVNSSTAKKTIVLPTYDSTSFRVSNPAKLLITDTGRVYIYGYNSGNSYTTVIEINTSTGAQLRYVDGSSTSTQGWDSYAEIYNNEIYFMSWTGRIDVTSLNLGSVTRTYNYTNSVNNSPNKSHIDFTKGLIAYSQTSNQQVALRKLSDGTLLQTISLGYSSPSCLFTKNYLVVVEEFYWINVYDLNGNKIHALRPKKDDGSDLVAYPGVLMQVQDDLIVFHNHTTANTVVYFDAAKGKVITYQNNVGGTSSDSYGNQRNTMPVMLEDKRFTLSRFSDYGLFQGYQKIVK